MIPSAKPMAAGLVVLLLAACAAEQAELQPRPAGETITGSNIPRREGQVRRETTIMIDDGIADMVKSNGPRGKPNP